MTARPLSDYRGDDKLLFGIILGVLAFWLFAQTTLNIAPTMAADLDIATSVMNIAVSITALFSGIFIVVVGGLADRLGRVKILMWGFVFSIVGSRPRRCCAIGRPRDAAPDAGPHLSGLVGRLHHAGESRAHQRRTGTEPAVSARSAYGPWDPGVVLASLPCSAASWQRTSAGAGSSSPRRRCQSLGMLMVRGTPESKAAVQGSYTFDTKGVLTFMVTMVALQVLTTQGSQMGWTNPITLGLAAIAGIFGVLFFRAESAAPFPFVNFGLFRNATFTGATVSNFLLNGVAGMLLVSMMLVQIGGGLSAQEAGMLTLGYAITIVAFIRVGEKLLQKFGARRPMIWGSLIVGLSVLLLMPTNLLIGQYKVLAVVAYTLFGLGLAFYATPSTDAALSNLPDDQAGSGAGIYKMASSLGASFGVAISAAIFTALSANDDSIPVAEWGAHLHRAAGQRAGPPGGSDCIGLQPDHGRRGDRVDHAHRSKGPWFGNEARHEFAPGLSFADAAHRRTANERDRQRIRGDSWKRSRHGVTTCTSILNSPSKR